MNEETSQILSEIEREQLEIYLQSGDAPPRWMVPLFGLLAGLTIASIDLRNPWVTILAVVIASAVIGGSMALLEKRAGFSARIASLPEPLRRRTYGFMVVGGLLIAAGLAVVFLFPDSPIRFTIAGAVAFLVIAVGGTWFQSDYRARAEQLARELGMTSG